MAPDDPKAELTREWLTKAEHDLVAAERAATPPPLPDVTAFHCQQAAEKALKAYLTWHDRPFRRSHQLAELLEQCGAIVPEFRALTEAAQTLTPYAVVARYPPLVAEPTVGEAREALRLAHEVMSFVLARLPADARP
ncbi:MAG: DNA-binding protein [Planctomycetes bacterium]|jgi:HEPN domain-containing protein|nr:DNA-binding protein [Planctomycetota bacterium]